MLRLKFLQRFNFKPIWVKIRQDQSPTVLQWRLKSFKLFFGKYLDKQRIFVPDLTDVSLSKVTGSIRFGFFYGGTHKIKFISAILNNTRFKKYYWRGFLKLNNATWKCFKVHMNYRWNQCGIYRTTFWAVIKQH